MKFATGHKLSDLTREKSQIGLFRVKSICRNYFSSCSSTEITGTFSAEKPAQTQNTLINIYECESTLVMESIEKIWYLYFFLVFM